MRGGAEDVCLHAIEALQEDGHEVTLFTLTRPDFSGLNEYFATSVSTPTVRVPGRLGPLLARNLENKLVRLQACLLYRAARNQLSSFDVVVSTKNEFPCDVPSVQYVHSPRFEAKDPGLDRKSLAKSAYERLIRAIVDFDPERVASSTLLANSDWTAGLVEDVYDTQVQTVYPPVSLSGFEPTPWSEREDGFLTIGRVGPSKRILKNIDIVGQLRDRGHDVHLHIVGPTSDSAYSERVRERGADLSFVHIEGSVSHERLLELLGSHRYGLHGRPYEHFGITVAELASAGAIPFAPDSGGQREILGQKAQLMYSDIDDAIEKMETVLSSPKIQSSVRDDLESVREAYSPERFKKDICSAVNQALP
ncbi:Glycosyltransferase involved in cell wall bisynthesis [Haloarchaeobius iranensis]|uniref:Glycosyltransferase involved in cell wall bisynthesis n=2 Tax=Haloarchaeobius iranensis TaxID=996166 RepID=A0A1H0BUJ1_9EURY|nr:Glycosyltransferase involved in cell wall bisynthesis [Haloarchaeobius iranensis]